MPTTKKDIVAQLQKDILRLQGFKPRSGGFAADTGLGAINDAFPNGVFPLGAVHEFIAAEAEDKAATSGFVTGLLSCFMQTGGVMIWISASRTLFPPALKIFGIEPGKIIFIDLKKEKDVLWAMEEALKCGAVSAVVAELAEVSFTASRRLQLAVEQSQVTGFILRHSPRIPNITACVSRWKITSLPSRLEEDLPGVGYPHWKVELLKVRNGKPGSWEIWWADGEFHQQYTFASIVREDQKKTG